jgi:hypothetical protein
MHRDDGGRRAPRRPRRDRERERDRDPADVKERIDREFAREIDMRISYFLQSPEQELELEPMNSYRRRMVHSLAGKYRLRSESRGEDRERYVCLVKTGDTPAHGEAPAPGEEPETDAAPAYGEEPRAGRGPGRAPAPGEEPETDAAPAYGEEPRAGRALGRAPARSARSEGWGESRASGRAPAHSEGPGEGRGPGHPSARSEGPPARPARLWDYGSQTFPVNPGKKGIHMALKVDGSIEMYREQDRSHVLADRVITAREFRVREGKLVMPGESGY